MDGPRSLESYLMDFRSVSVPIEPAHDRDVSRERKVIAAYCESWEVDWRNLVEKWASILPPMRESVRVAALAPARMECTRIAGLLGAIASETQSCHKYQASLLELSILENWLSCESRDETSDIVKAWRHRTRHLFDIHLLQHEFDVGQKCRLSRARKLLADVAVYRSLQRPVQVGPLYLLSEDADVTAVDSGRSVNGMEFLDRYPHIDAIRGLQERSLASMRSNDLLLLERRSWQFTELLLSSQALHPNKWSDANFYWNRVVTAGSNVFVAAETYALIGGYSVSVPLFEDMDIGQRISVMRGKYTQYGFMPNVTTIKRCSHREESSAVRILLALAEEKALYDDGNPEASFFDVAHEQRVRTISEDSLLVAIAEYAKICPSNAWRFEAVLSGLLSETHRIMQDKSRTDALFRRVMCHMGFAPEHYKCDGGVVLLVNTQGFRNCAETFRRRTSQEAPLYSRSD